MSVSSDIILWKIHSRCPDFHLPANGFLLNDLKGRGQTAKQEIMVDTPISRFPARPR